MSDDLLWDEDHLENLRVRGGNLPKPTMGDITLMGILDDAERLSCVLSRDADFAPELCEKDRNMIIYALNNLFIGTSDTLYTLHKEARKIRDAEEKKNVVNIL